jgi:hypothetical protein
MTDTSEHYCEWPGHDTPVLARTLCDLCIRYYCDECLKSAIDPVTGEEYDEVCPVCRERCIELTVAAAESKALARVCAAARAALVVLLSIDWRHDGSRSVGKAQGILEDALTRYDVERQARETQEKET